MRSTSACPGQARVRRPSVAAPGFWWVTVMVQTGRTTETADVNPCSRDGKPMPHWSLNAAEVLHLFAKTEFWEYRKT